MRPRNQAWEGGQRAHTHSKSEFRRQLLTYPAGSPLVSEPCQISESRYQHHADLERADGKRSCRGQVYVHQKYCPGHFPGLLLLKRKALYLTSRIVAAFLFGVGMLFACFHEEWCLLLQPPPPYQE